ncbi:MAG: hypothetical protein AAB443_05050 [Patescibacteria group bacterium]
MKASEASELEIGQVIYWKAPGSERWIEVAVVKPYQMGWVIIKFQADYEVAGMKFKKDSERRVGSTFLSARLVTTKGKKLLLEPIESAS